MITKEFDRTSPLLAKAWDAREVLDRWELAVALPSAKGGESTAFTITLIDAQIDPIKHLTTAEGAVHEEMAFTYRRIEWTTSLDELSWSSSW